MQETYDTIGYQDIGGIEEIHIVIHSEEIKVVLQVSCYVGIT